MKHVTVCNATGQAIPYDEEGHSVYPGEWASVPYNKAVRRLIEGGSLTELDHSTLGDSSNPDAVRAAEETDAANKALEKDKPDTMSAATAKPASKKARE